MSAQDRAAMLAGGADALNQWLVGEYFSHSFPQILGKCCEVITVAHPTKPSHDSVRTTIDPIRSCQPDERLHCFCGEGWVSGVSVHFNPAVPAEAFRLTSLESE